jgi:UTP--glucose-1-phosphate uridylyltransferase
MIENQLKKVRETLYQEGCSHQKAETFLQLLKRYYFQKEQPYLDWQQVESPDETAFAHYNTLKDCPSTDTQKLLNKLVVCKLNGGLGTSMGCIGPKSAIEVRNEKTFLDLIVAQVQTMNTSYDVNIPLILMNSVNTHDDTSRIIEKYLKDTNILTFEQNSCLRIRQDTLHPVSQKDYGQQAMYPPGHGDFFNSFQSSGLLDQLLTEGKEYIFVSNVDNLGATIDTKILTYLENNEIPFLMEVTPKTIADVKGGTLVKMNGKTRLLEIAQVPKEYTRDFMNVRKFRVFNTNNMWINLKALKKRLEKPMELDLIVNQKQLDNVPVIQLETAMGSAINCFEHSKAVIVNRNRFLPVKTTNDLLLVQSNLFKLDKGNIFRNPDRHFDQLPIIKLGRQFKTVEQYQKRFASIPDMIDLHSLTILGDVYLEKNITLAGNVIINCESKELHIPERSYLSDQFLTGNIKTESL